MKKIILSQNKFTLVDNEDYELVNEWKWSYAAINGGMAYRKEPNTQIGKTLYLHRVLMGAKRGQEIDHINHDSLDNRRSNLRIASRSQNAANRRVQRNSNSGLKGVTFDKTRNKWLAYAKKDGKRYFGGYHGTKEAAGNAYDELAIKLHGSFAVLNSLS